MPKREKVLTIAITGAPLRADLAILAELRKDDPALSRSTVKYWMTEGLVRGGGKPLKASEELSPGFHELTLSAFDLTPPEARPAPEGNFLPVVFEDEDLLILHKFTGVPSIPHSPEETRTAVGGALAHFPDLKNVGRKGLEPGILHRLDTGTSGLLVFAKNETEFERLLTAWKAGIVRKTYLALAQGKVDLPKLPITLTTPLGHDARSSKRMIALLTPQLQKQIRGNPLRAVTHIQRARTLSSAQGPLTEFEIEIETGVMHQIRCHLASIGFPLVGDPIYRGAPSERLWLHAWKLSFPLKNGMSLTIRASLPEGWPAASD